MIQCAFWGEVQLHSRKKTVCMYVHLSHKYVFIRLCFLIYLFVCAHHAHITSHHITFFHIKCRYNVYNILARMCIYLSIYIYLSLSLCLCLCACVSLSLSLHLPLEKRKTCHKASALRFPRQQQHSRWHAPGG